MTPQREQEKKPLKQLLIDYVRGSVNLPYIRATLLGADIIGESDPLTHDVHPVSFNEN
jgi:hypothetical protein